MTDSPGSPIAKNPEPRPPEPQPPDLELQAVVALQTPDGFLHRDIDRRLRSIEQLVDVVKHISDKGESIANEYLEQQSTDKDKARAAQDKQNRRAFITITYAVSLLFGLCFAALYKNQFELVKLILTSGLAVAAGAGIAALSKK
jgi:hypothetical protein